MTEFDKDAYRRVGMPKRLGEVISGWDLPAMTPADRATYLRDDDHVIGLVVGGRARAYPLWILDNYHVVNDRVGETAFVVASCERCQSGSAFLSEPPGRSEREPLFRSVGFLNATLILTDLRSGSHWIHWEGFGLDRAARGRRLPWLQTLQMEWADWRALHPETEVMLPPPDPTHPDARHGHGREEFFSRPGMDPAFLDSIVGPLDDTYPENETILAIESDDRWFAFPLREVHRSNGVIETSIGDDPVAVLAGPRPDGFTMVAYDPRLEDRRLTFERGSDGFVDNETGSRWSIEGEAVEGALAGNRLRAVRSFQLRWHALAYCHRGAELWQSLEPPPRFSGHDRTVVGAFGPALSHLAAGGRDVVIEGPVVSQRRPRGSAASLTIRVDGHRINLHHMRSESAARDYEAFEGAVSGWPVRERAIDFRVRSFGSLVIESDPEGRFADPAQIVRLPYRSIPWAPLLDSPTLDPPPLTAATTGEVAVGFLEVVRALRVAGFEVLEVGFLPPGQLRVGCEDAIALTIDADRFLLYRFGTSEQADAYAGSEPHSLALNRFVVRSTPETMYVHQQYEIAFAGDEWVRWSSLLSDPRFVGTLRSAVVASGDTQPAARPRPELDELESIRHD
ncbi:MAG: DUF3179 domain-containing (seleno)protein [Actinomycetota bacterium]